MIEKLCDVVRVDGRNSVIEGGTLDWQRFEEADERLKTINLQI